MKKLIVLLSLVLQSVIANSQVFEYRVDGYYKFNHSDSVDTYTAFKEHLEVDMGSDSVNLIIKFNHETMRIEFNDLMGGTVKIYKIFCIDPRVSGIIKYQYFDGRYLKNFTVFQNTPTEKLMVMSSEYEGRIYGWEAVVK